MLLIINTALESPIFAHHKFYSIIIRVTVVAPEKVISIPD